MNLDIYNLSAKALVGEELTDEEKSTLSEYNARYKLVRWLVMEKLNSHEKEKGSKYEGYSTKDFQFTPGDRFLETPVIDIVNGVIESFSLPSEPLVFGDGTFVFDDDGNPIPQRGVYGNPPVTGKPKTRLGE
jgi:hypothetical protein